MVPTASDRSGLFWFFREDNEAGGGRLRPAALEGPRSEKGLSGSVVAGASASCGGDDGG